MNELDKPISECEPIQISSGIVLAPTQLKDFVELPVLAAAEMINGYGIRTLSSSANKKYIGDEAHLIIEMNSLCTVNEEKIRRAAEAKPDGIKFGSNPEWGEYASLSIPIADGGISARSISDSMTKLVEGIGFLRQPAYWAKPEECRAFFKRHEEALNIDGLTHEPPEVYVPHLGAHYDSQSNVVYPSKALAGFYDQSVRNAEPGTSTQVKAGRIQK